MVRHYFRVAVRSLLKRKFYSATNIFGLAIGLALCLTVIGHVSYELSFEDFHANKDRICRVEGNYSFEDSVYSTVRVMAPLGPALVEGFSEVENAAVFRVGQVTSVAVNQERSRVIDEHKGKGYAHGNKLIFAGPEYFDVFTFPLINGTPTALAEPNTVFVTEQAIRTFFEGRNPMGEEIIINDSIACQVRGILKDIPQNTQLYAQFIVSYPTLARLGEELNSWSQFDRDYVYLALRDERSAETIRAGLAGLVKQYLPPEEARKYQFDLMPFKDIYFSVYGSGKWGQLSPAGEKSFIYETGAIALFILIIAIANFINLSTARAAERMKEVGVRKVFGAFRSHLVRQFLGESIVIALVSTALAALFYEILKSQTQGMLAREMLIDFYRSPLMLACVVGLMLAVGVVAGLYPAVYLSRFRPIAVLQAKTKVGSSKSWLRRILVAFQFAIAALFVFCTTVLVRQTVMMTTLQMGFERENVLLLDFEGDQASEECLLMKNQVLTHNRVLAASAVNSPPGREINTYYGFYKTEIRQPEDMVVGRLFAVDYDFISTFGLKLVDGQAFSPDRAEQAGNSLIITETTAEELGRADPVGTRIFGGGDIFYEIVGVVDDFVPAAARVGSERSVFLRIKPDLYRTLAIRLPADDVAGSIAAIQETWERTFPGYQFTYTFLDDEIDSGLAEYRGQASIFVALAVFAISIAGLGIFGLVSFTSSQRMREIGVRKVMGASVPSIVALLSREFVILTVIASVIALPVATMIMMDVLRWFPQRVSMGPGTYLFVVVLVVAVALASTCFQSLRAATANPVDALRCE